MFGQRQVSFLVLVVVLGATHVSALIEDQRDIDALQFRNEALDPPMIFAEPDGLPPQAADRAERAISNLDASRGEVDVLGGRFSTLVTKNEFIPGPGNQLTWFDEPPLDEADIGNEVLNQFVNFVKSNKQDFDIEPAELLSNPKVTTHHDGSVVQIYAPRKHNGFEVRGSYMTCAVENGNAVLYGTNRWADIFFIPTNVQITESEGLETLQEYLGEAFTVDGTWGDSDVYIVPMSNQGRRGGIKNTFKRGYLPRLVMEIKPKVQGYDICSFVAILDATTGRMLAFQDLNDYVSDARVVGGVFPVSNDEVPPDGIEQGGWPMPYAYVTIPGIGTKTGDMGGNVDMTGVTSGTALTANLAGPYVKMNDNCGTISLTETSGELDFGSSGADCATPGFGGAGNTRSSRTGFYELNMIKEMARSQLPGNSWLQGQLTANMNINNSCNAFWNGSTVNFYRSGGGCGNTGEIAGVFDHEFGHGLDANDANPGIASPSGEGIADVYTAIRLNDSCIGRGFRATGKKCSAKGGDECLTCTGVRDIDYLKYQSGQPHTFTWSNANCGSSVHCIGLVYSEAVWNLWKRELQRAPYNMDDNTAHELVTYLTYVGGGAVGTWFSGSPNSGGCGATNGYMNFITADDDDGDLNNGTPHMTAIYNAFHTNEIACDTPAVQDSGCEEVSLMSPPVVTVNSLPGLVSLSWNAVTGASAYEIFRTDGVHECEFGKIRLGQTNELTFSDFGLLPGRTYYYVVIPKGAKRSCFGPASPCMSATMASEQEGTTTSGCEIVDFESGASGWTNDPASTCSTGTFVVATPTLVVYSGVTTQVGGDHTTGTGNAFFTAINTAAGTNDVDSGECQARSPEYTVNEPSRLSFWYFHGQARTNRDNSDDYFYVEIFTNSQGTWTSLIGTGDVVVQAAWTKFSTFVDESFSLRVRVADGTASGDLVEAGIDDIEICPLGTQPPMEEPTNPPTKTPTNSPSSAPTKSPTKSPTDSPTETPTNSPSSAPTKSPTKTPTKPPTKAPSESPTLAPTKTPTKAPTKSPTESPTKSPTEAPTESPTKAPSQSPTKSPTEAPTKSPTATPTKALTKAPTKSPTKEPTKAPTGAPTKVPTEAPTASPTAPPTESPTKFPTRSPTNAPTAAPTKTPTIAPVLTEAPTNSPTATVTNTVTEAPSNSPTESPTKTPTKAPTNSPTESPTKTPTKSPTKAPTEAPTKAPTKTPTKAPTKTPTKAPTKAPTMAPTKAPTKTPTKAPTKAPTNAPTQTPTKTPTKAPTKAPTNTPTEAPTKVPTNAPTKVPTRAPTKPPTKVPTMAPTEAPTEPPTDAPTNAPTKAPTNSPTNAPTEAPTSSPTSAGTTSPQLSCTTSVDFENGLSGWANAAESTCTTGTFEVGRPNQIGTTTTQVDGDHTPGMNGAGNALYTEPNSSLGTEDVDGGVCISESPEYITSKTFDSEVSVWYFHGQRDEADDLTGDFFKVQISTNGGPWGNIARIDDVSHVAEWTQAKTRVSANSRVKLRVQASDGTQTNQGDIVEAGIDDVSICEVSSTCTVLADFESGAQGWSNDGSTCSTGTFTVGTPDEVTNEGVRTQVGGDHTTGTGNAFFTAPNLEGDGTDDVDGGECKARSQEYVVNEPSELSFWYYFGQRDRGDDVNDYFFIEMSTDGGVSWDVLVSKGDTTVVAEWTQHSGVYVQENFILRIRASDASGPGDLVEAGIDDIHLCPL